MITRWVVAMLPGVALVWSAATGFSSESTKPVRIELPLETARLAPAELPGYVTAQAYCLTCHSVDYVRMQPTMNRAFWQAEVVKMQKTFGAPIPDAEVASLVDYFVKTYGAEKDQGAGKKAEGGSGSDVPRMGTTGK